MFKYFLGMPRAIKRIITLCIDTVVIAVAFFGALLIRYDNESFLYDLSFWVIYSCLLPITLVSFIKLGLYRAVIRFITIKILKTVLVGAVISVIVMLVLGYMFHINIPRTVPIMYFIFLTFLTFGVRVFFKTILTMDLEEDKKYVVIYGAGDAGRQLVTMMHQIRGYSIVALVDDNSQLHKLTLHGIRVYSPNCLAEIVKNNQVSQILLAMPSVPISRRKQIINSLSHLPCEILSVPNMEDILSGKAKLTSLNKISIDELLGRDAVEPMPELLSSNITGKNILVTGAGGSIGSELCRQIIKQLPNSLVIFELSEFNLYAIDSELRLKIKELGTTIRIVPILGTIQNREHLNEVMQSFNISTVYHAAAYKHVPLVEYNIVEGCRNNILGTLNCALAAIENKVETFVLVSTDKAVRPTNTMGATKRVAELILQALAKKQNNTRFCMVRFGNVLGSSGSVVPLFKKQIETGGPITLTHPEITRYFMTIPEASSLVIQAGAMGTGGEVFVLDMGDSVRIIDLAKRMIALSGLKEKTLNNPTGDIEIKITGLRPGEKLYEELLIGDNVEETIHPRIMKAKEIMLNWDKLETYLTELEIACVNRDIKYIRRLLEEMPTAFSPVDNICDLIFIEKASDPSLNGAR